MGGCVCESFSSASTGRSLPTRPWFVLGTSSWVTTPPQREKEHNENRKPILRWQGGKKSLGEMACAVFAATVTLGNGLYCNKPKPKAEMTQTVHDAVCLPVQRLCNKLCKRRQAAQVSATAISHCSATLKKNKGLSRCDTQHLFPFGSFRLNRLRWWENVPFNWLHIQEA